ncbi:MAG: hypothetical protein IPK33_16475 [Gemmatimonadetes bacterium]|nr:hypothetical protein [Gemmatimonadota bacterium]
MQERLANAAIDLYLSIAALSRVTSELEAVDGDVTRVANEVDCARVFIHMAYRRTRRALKALRINQDARLDTIAARAVDAVDLAPLAPTDR